jgi:hypothetical protein
MSILPEFQMNLCNRDFILASASVRKMLTIGQLASKGTKVSLHREMLYRPADCPLRWHQAFQLASFRLKHENRVNSF